MNFINKLITQKIVIGMVHTEASPGAPKNILTVQEIIPKAVREAKLYEKLGIDAIIIENMHDVPYLMRNAGAEVVATLTAVAIAVKSAISLPIGIQILAGANKQAIAVAQAANLDFIRAEGFVFSHIADEGLMNADAAELLRFRKNIGADNISIFCDIKKKHSSHALTADISIAEFAKTADFFLANGLIVTGNSTAEAADIKEVESVKKVTKNPVLIGSGITAKNIEKYWNSADGFIIGSYFKHDGYWENEIDENRVNKLMQNVKILRQKNEQNLI